MKVVLVYIFTLSLHIYHHRRIKYSATIKNLDFNKRTELQKFNQKNVSRGSDRSHSKINTPLFNKSRTKIGVKPQGLLPIYQPDIVVDAILYAACYPTCNLIAGGAGRAMDLIQRISPQLMDTLLLQPGWKLTLRQSGVR